MVKRKEETEDHGFFPNRKLLKIDAADFSAASDCWNFLLRAVISASAVATAVSAPAAADSAASVSPTVAAAEVSASTIAAGAAASASIFLLRLIFVQLPFASSNFQKLLAQLCVSATAYNSFFSLISLCSRLSSLYIYTYIYIYIYIFILWFFSSLGSCLSPLPQLPLFIAAAFFSFSYSISSSFPLFF
ncbi:hypothetical protein M9H77_04231 [Catharanthus roseus]|uniref:Uncharacterized protein n=1 Tax=Catharanthus roseus TaxID=4058 RepID=A0ACC0CDE2_CATRO|nr:hypothetical protein M9H77_04231 [Catharanthus roseus]